MRIYRFFLYVPMVCALCLCACDLQPKIASIPDNVGMFIESRYPALLADPQSQPEIYNSAVTDYGVYASPELYGSTNIDDYVLYASVDDYVLVPQKEEVSVDKAEPENKLKDEVEEEIDEDFIEQEIMSEYLIVPVYGGNTVIDEVEDEVVPVKEEKKTESEQPKKSEEKQVAKLVESKPKNPDEIIVERGDTVYSLARKYNIPMEDFVKINNLKEPYTLKIGQKLTLRADEKNEKVAPKVKPEKPIPNVISEEKVKQIKAEKSEKIVVKETVKPNSTKRVDIEEITVAKGDTLYSLSRKYQIPVNDLAVMNKLTAPFNLTQGQKLKVPKLDKVQTRSAVVVKKTEKKKEDSAKPQKQKAEKKKIEDKKTQEKKTVKEKTVESKAESKPKTQTKNSAESKTPLKIAARSSSKFSWPVRGKILSGYGPKNGGLVNDGINISAPLGTTVKAAENGVVAYSGNEVKGMGNLIILQHSDGWMTVYAHLNSMDVRRGARVSVGQPIGKIGKTGKVDKPQLHFEIRKGTKSYNPTSYLKK